MATVSGLVIVGSVIAGFVVAGVFAGWPSVAAADLSRKESDLFEQHVRPTLVAHCIKCHGEIKQEGGLKLTTLSDLVRGGDSGPAVVPGKADESLIIEAIRFESLEMPPDDPLKNDLVEGLARWVDAGAPWPRDVVLTATRSITDEDRKWWCYQPIAKVDPPSVSSSMWSINEIDHFVWQRLRENGLRPGEAASAEKLIRRASFAVTGLPPTEQDLVAAKSDDFDYEAAIDRLLDRDAYGENQARMWLDLVRYAETDGYRADHDRPHAHLYRDYVIRSFNADKPYDQFIREQLAGDEIDPGNRDAIIATQYLRHWIYEHNQRDVETQWNEILSDITETTADVFLALGLKCARCHDHKFDPLLQKDYFRFQAFFAAFQPVKEHPVADVAARSAYQEKLAKWETATETLRKRLRQIEYPVALEHATREGFDKFIPEIQAMIKTPIDQRKPYEKQIAAMAERQFDLPYDKLDQWLDDEQKSERQKLKQQLAELDDLKPKPLPSVPFVATDVGHQAPATFIPDDSDKTPIAPGFITLLDDREAKISPTAAPLQTTGRRTALANWIASTENPLTARVIVNRVWQQHFGRGLVETSSDFGRLGSPPTHPLLLDFLARRFVADGWSLKKLHRLILTSATYRQNSQRPADSIARRVDPGNTLLWRMNPRRLTGEEINDAILVASGELKRQKRAIYKPVKRNTPDPLLKAFDGPDRIRSNGRRHRTTTANQSLLLSNSDWANQRSEAIASRLAASQSVTDESFIDAAYQRLFSRSATDEEIRLAADFIESYASQTPLEPIRPVAAIESFAKTESTSGDRHLGVRLYENSDVEIKLSDTSELLRDQLTVEAIVLCQSLYKNASVRTIATTWNGSKNSPGWSLGVTSQKSAFQPRNLILQLVGKVAGGEKLHYEVVASNLRLPLNQACYVAASIDINDPSQDGITFYLRPLDQPDQEMQTAQAPHTVTSGIGGSDLMIGSRGDSHRWDGLIGNVRIENRVRDLTMISQAGSDDGMPQYVIEYRFDNPRSIGHDSSGNEHHADVNPRAATVLTPHQRGRIALVHALLNSNELIYVD